MFLLDRWHCSFWECVDKFCLLFFPPQWDLTLIVSVVCLPSLLTMSALWFPGHVKPDTACAFVIQQWNHSKRWVFHILQFVRELCKTVCNHCWPCFICFYFNTVRPTYSTFLFKLFQVTGVHLYFGIILNITDVILCAIMIYKYH